MDISIKQAYDAAVTHMRRRNQFLYFTYLELKEEFMPAGYCATHTGNTPTVIIDVRALGNTTEAQEFYNIKNLSFPQNAFILAHECVHHMLKHTTASSVHERYMKENRALYTLAVESHCNAEVVSLLGYKMPDVAQPLDNSKSVWAWSGDYGVDPKGLHWVEIYELLKAKGVRPADGNSDDFFAVGTGSGDKIDAMVRRALGKSAGSNVGSFAGLRITNDKPPLPFDVMLRNIKASTQAKAPSWKRPNKRQLPLRGASDIAKRHKVMVYVDTSCSVDDLTIVDVASRIAAADKNVECTLCYFDTKVYVNNMQSATEISSARDLHIPSRGGTDFNPPAQHWVEEACSEYDFAVCVTDGECSLPTVTDKLHRWAWLIHSNSKFHAEEKVFIYKEMTHGY